jgi:acetylornithine deacetylase/succinyl-diaminopimelate desuccinylase-like protein
LNLKGSFFMKVSSSSVVVQLLRDFVAIPSVNPTGDPGTDGINEEGMADYLRDFLRQAGARTRFQVVAPHRPNVIGVWRPAGKIRARVLFAPHTDTVSVRGMTVAPFDPVIKQGRVYGRGSSDTKGPMAAMLVALQEWTQTAAWEKAGVEVTFIGLMGEEAGNDGAIAWAKAGPRYDFVVVGEPTDLKVVYAHKGASWFELTSKGKACHGSTPERGRNAIYPMAAAITAIEKEVIPQFALWPHPSLGVATANVGTIRGGAKVNIVPDECRVELDVRTVPTCDEKRVLGWLREKVPAGVQVIKQRAAPPLDNDSGNPWIQQLLEASSGLAVAPWFCDAAIFSRSGMVAVAFGPGLIAQAHTKDEFIAVTALEAGVRAYRRFLDQL